MRSYKIAHVHFLNDEAYRIEEILANASAGWRWSHVEALFTDKKTFKVESLHNHQNHRQVLKTRRPTPTCTTPFHMGQERDVPHWVVCFQLILSTNTVQMNHIKVMKRGELNNIQKFLPKTACLISSR